MITTERAVISPVVYTVFLDPPLKLSSEYCSWFSPSPGTSGVGVTDVDDVEADDVEAGTSGVGVTDVDDVEADDVETGTSGVGVTDVDDVEADAARVLVDLDLGSFPVLLLIIVVLVLTTAICVDVPVVLAVGARAGVKAEVEVLIGTGAFLLVTFGAFLLSTVVAVSVAFSEVDKLSVVVFGAACLIAAASTETVEPNNKINN
nr:11312_t:CDS:2 [Entrophospora candida]CAG8485250.1 7869_t:CDS:2 [Entrophospora candida]